MTQKNGKRKKKQRYKCHNCGHVLENKNRNSSKLRNMLFYDYVQRKQTYESLAETYKISQRTVSRKLDQVEPEAPLIQANEAVVLMDSCYFRRGFGVMVFRDSYTKQNLLWRFIKHETLKEYIWGITYLQNHKVNVLGIVCDGKRGLFRAFGNIPVQMCQFHQTQIITRYVTKKPKLPAGKELREISMHLKEWEKDRFLESIENWHRKWKSFLDERKYSEEMQRSYYVHKRLRSAYRSIKTNAPYLFVYQKYPELRIPNTTNSLEGVFSNLKTKLRVHSGLTDERKIKIVNKLLA